MRWVIQKNLINVEDHDKIRDICLRHGYAHESIDVVPFSPDLPDIGTDQPTVFYGATNFINNIYLSRRWHPGTFFTENFTMRVSIEHYKDHMLNYPCSFSTIKEFAASHQPADKLFFVRPVKDLKEFSGEVMEFNKVVKWERNMRYLPGCGCDNNPNLTVDTEILISEPCGIAHEWRTFIVNGKVSSGSHYRSYMKLDANSDLPKRIVNFAEEMCRIWMPSPIFAMDIGESAGNLFIVECGCFNSAGFYKSDVEKIIIDISSFIMGP